MPEHITNEIEILMKKQKKSENFDKENEVQNRRK